MLEVEVDDVDAEALETRVARLLHVLGAAVDEVAADSRILHLAELRHDERAVALALESPAQKLLVLPPAVHVRRVEQSHAEVERPMDDPDRFVVVRLAVDAGHRHQAETDRGRRETALAEGALFHGDPPERVKS